MALVSHFEQFPDRRLPHSDTPYSDNTQWFYPYSNNSQDFENSISNPSSPVPPGACLHIDQWRGEYWRSTVSTDGRTLALPSDQTLRQHPKVEEYVHGSTRRTSNADRNVRPTATKGQSRRRGSTQTRRREGNSPQSPSVTQQQRILDAGSDNERERFLRRNREAAERFRQRRKGQEDSLKSQVWELERSNAYLHESAAALRYEVLELKEECLKYFNCGCDNGIRDYLIKKVAILTER